MITDISQDGLAALSTEEGGSVAHVYQNILSNGILDKPTAGVGHVLRDIDFYDSGTGNGPNIPCKPPFYPFGSPAWKSHAVTCPGIPQWLRDGWLKSDLRNVTDSIVRLSRQCEIVFTQNMFDALVSLAYNAGTVTDLPQDSHVALALTQGNLLGAARHMLDWDKAGGKPSDLLLARRWREVARFLSPDESAIISVEEAADRLGLPRPA